MKTLNLDGSSALIDTAEELANRGLYEPAVITARAALERALGELLPDDRAEIARGGMIGGRGLAKSLRHAKRISSNLDREVSVLNERLSRIAHGYETTAHEAMKLIERTGAALVKVRRAHESLSRREELKAAKRVLERKLAS